MILPSFCIAESYSTLLQQSKKRAQLGNDLASEIRQLSRSEPYKREIDVFGNATALLVRSSQEDEQRLVSVLDQVLKVADLIPLEAHLIRAATQNRGQYSLEAQDSIVFSSVLHHLSSAGDVESCFINRNRQDFNNPDIESVLSSMRCKLLFNFDTASNYIQKP